MSTQRERGETFRALHLGEGLLVLPNPWDAGSAKMLAHLGFQALATTSAGLAFSLGRRDAEGAVGAGAGTDVEGYLRASEFSRDRVDDLSKVLKEGDTVQAMIINVDCKNRSTNLSVKAKDMSR